jgi:hypothetical protein
MPILLHKGEGTEKQRALFLHFTPHSSLGNQGNQVDLITTPKALLKYADKLSPDCGRFEIPSNHG